MKESGKEALHWCMVLLVVLTVAALANHFYLARERGAEYALATNVLAVSAQNNNEPGFEAIPRYAVTAGVKQTMERLEVFTPSPADGTTLYGRLDRDDAQDTTKIFSDQGSRGVSQDIYVTDAQGQPRTLARADAGSGFLLGIDVRAFEGDTAAPVYNAFNYSYIRITDRFQVRHEFLVINCTVYDGGLSYIDEDQIIPLSSQDNAGVFDEVQAVNVFGNLERDLNALDGRYDLYGVIQADGRDGARSLKDLFAYGESSEALAVNPEGRARLLNDLALFVIRARQS